MELKGLPVKRVTVSPACHKKHGMTPAGLIAMDEIRKAYEEFSKLPQNKNVKWHFALSMERG